ncbi:cell wall protein RBR3-like [Trifolium pratense]|uniref:cell wall protein RBR3-like n=1 Tax=Trifolium pratense TaxID=57577 RepID=UPI001E694669|nr:cell wall protein RBR3-like [Trifolium pratense]
MEPMKQEEDGSMQQYCINHPTKKNPGGICAFCLQEKLGKLVSSSFPLPITTPSSSSSLSSPPSSSPSFRSQTLPSSSSSSSLSIPPSSSSKHNHHMRSRLPFLIPKKNHKKTPSFINMNMNMNNSVNGSSDIVFKRSKSTTTPRRTKFLDDDDDVAEGDFNIRKRNRFWSFLYLSSKPSNSCNKKIEGNSNNSPRISTMKPKMCSLGRNCERVVEEDEEDEEDEQVSGSSSGSGNSLEQEQRKVSRSRSVGCGSRSFSGDFFEKISTGFGDCTLRRVESQREGKGNKVNSSSTGNGNIQHCMKERVKCGGIFSGFMMMNSSSSSVSSSSYWVSSSDDGRSRSSSWSWALASPMRAFSSKSTSKDNKSTSEKRNSPNLSAVPSLLIARG